MAYFVIIIYFFLSSVLFIDIFIGLLRVSIILQRHLKNAIAIMFEFSRWRKCIFRIFIKREKFPSTRRETLADDFYHASRIVAFCLLAATIRFFSNERAFVALIKSYTNGSRYEHKRTIAFGANWGMRVRAASRFSQRSSLSLRENKTKLHACPSRNREAAVSLSLHNGICF